MQVYELVLSSWRIFVMQNKNSFLINAAITKECQETT